MTVFDHSYKPLIDRVGEPHFRQRFTLQVRHATRIFDQGRTFFHIENVEWLMIFIYYILKITGMYGRGYRNFKNIRIVENTVPLRDLPEAFDGFRILHLSDLHLDLDPSLTDIILEKLASLEYDLSVMTGDYRASTSGAYHKALSACKRVIGALKGTPYGVLGNHDFIEFVPHLEEAGMRMLLNETVSIEKEGQAIYLSGIDDPHFYETDNLHLARAAIPPSHISILLAHSPESYRAAASIGYDLMLSGHTHAGQICLPGRYALLSNAYCPRRMYYGAWEYEMMRGYTSSGTGSSGVPARFFCPPEIVVHTLRSLRGSIPSRPSCSGMAKRR